VKMKKNPSNFLSDAESMRLALMRSGRDKFAVGGAVSKEDEYLRWLKAQATGAAPGGEKRPVEPERELSVPEKIYGAGEAGLSMLSGAAAMPLAGWAGAVGELAGAGRGEDIAGEAGASMTYSPRTETGQEMADRLYELLGRLGADSLPPVVSGLNPAAFQRMPLREQLMLMKAGEFMQPMNAYGTELAPGKPQAMSVDAMRQALLQSKE
jgi:hypothetical protein